MSKASQWILKLEKQRDAALQSIAEIDAELAEPTERETTKSRPYLLSRKKELQKKVKRLDNRLLIANAAKNLPTSIGNPQAGKIVNYPGGVQGSGQIRRPIPPPKTKRG
jgi:hypothetical protein